MPYRWIAEGGYVLGNPPRAYLRVERTPLRPEHNPFDPFGKQKSFEGIRAVSLNYLRLYEDWRRTYLEAKANAERLDAPILRIRAMQGTIKLLQDKINLAQKKRAEIKLGERGLKQLDADLAGLKARFDGIYDRWDPDELPPPSEWTPQEWTEFEEDLEGPILTWTIKDCRDKWGIPFTPPCEGPDFLLATQTLNGLAEARMAELDMTDPLINPIGAFYAHAQLFFEEFADDASGAVKEAAIALAEGARDIANNIYRYVTEELPKVLPRALPWIGLAVVAGGGIWYLATKRKKN